MMRLYCLSRLSRSKPLSFQTNWRPAQADHTARQHGHTAVDGGKHSHPPSQQEYHDRSRSRQHRQRQKLAQHAVVSPRGHSRNMTMTVVVYAVGTLRRYRLDFVMDVNRRQH